ncbi:MAG: thioredoxin domain-containing protein [Planctomycetia bacterium]|nr:thioredoxin domain-containing protein [Planctomycetia bacterium]
MNRPHSEQAWQVERFSRPFSDRSTTASRQEERVVLLDFYNDACGPCRNMFPIVDRLKRRGYPVRKVNTTQEPGLTQRLQVTQIPCFVVLVDGQEYTRLVGMTTESRLEQMLLQGEQYRVALEQQKSARNMASTSTTPAAKTSPYRSAWRGKEAQVAVSDILLQRCTFPHGRAQNRGEETGNVVPASHTIASETSFPLQPISNPASENAPPRPPAYIPPISASENTPPLGNAAESKKSEHHQKILAATVRIRIQDASGQGCGSGTLIDARNGRALVLTCGHLFREYKPGDKIEVDLFGENALQGVEGRYVGHDLQSDLGLISIPVKHPVTILPVAPRRYPSRKGMPICTAGCSYGAIPTVQTGIVTNINRFLGTPNIEVSALPVQGRSGGGAFSEEGYVIGVCFAANPEDNEGIFSSVDAIYQYLDKMKLSEVAVQPRNESLQMGKPHPREQMAKTMPDTEPIILLTDLPMKKNPQTDLPRRATSIVEPSTPETPVTPVHVAVPTGEHSLTGEEIPSWPPVWR